MMVGSHNQVSVRAELRYLRVRIRWFLAFQILGTALKKRSGFIMAETTHVAGFRRVTPGIIASARLAMANDVPDTSKSEIALILKRAAPVLGIDGTTYHVMDILLSLSRADDWKGAARPIVAISNAKLAEYTQRSERTVMRCIKRLVEVGVAAYRDSSTGRRFVYRGDTGEVAVGYGIDFTPARVRVAELREAVENYQRRLAEDLAAKRDLARLARAIEDICHAFPEMTSDARTRMHGVLSSRSSLLDRAAALRLLHADLLETVAAVSFDQKESGKGDMGVTPIINTTLESSVNSNEIRTCSNEQDNFKNDSKAVDMAFEKKPTRGQLNDQEEINARTAKREPRQIEAEVLASVSIGLLQSACAEAQSLTGIHLDSWPSLARSGETFRRMLGLSEAGWLDGHMKIGLHAASAVLATVLEKHIRDPEQISNPAGYFRAMVDRAMVGKLNLERSLFGLAGAKYGN